MVHICDFPMTASRYADMDVTGKVSIMEFELS